MKKAEKLTQSRAKLMKNHLKSSLIKHYKIIQLILYIHNFYLNFNVVTHAKLKWKRTEFNF